jgi:hypothetical protein
MDFISREKIQKETDVFIGTPDCLNENLSITINHPKAINIYNLNSEYDNPLYVYTYGENLVLFKDKIDLLKNRFILISNNDDTNIYDNELYRYIANHPKIIKWYSQNVILDHPKLEMIPIGLANSKWKHGNLENINKAYLDLKANNIEKINKIYFYFTIETNKEKRLDCYLKLKDVLEISEKKKEEDYFNYLATFKFGICPEGNGIDSHRLWECFYLKVIPIVLNNPFIEKVKNKYNLPMIILNDWNELKDIKLEYNDFDNSILDFQKLKKEIFI